MKIKERYARRKKISNYLFFTVALLMLTLFFFHNTIWLISVFSLSLVLIIVSAHLNRCPNCKTRIREDIAKTCPKCGCELK